MSVEQNDVLRVTAEMSLGGNDVQNVMHFRSTNAASTPDGTALTNVATMVNTLYDTVDDLQSDQYDYDQVRVQNVTQDVLLGTTAWDTLVSGTRTEAALPLPVTALLTMPTTKPRVRGGLYLGGLTEQANTANGLLTTVLTDRLVLMGIQLLAEFVIGPDSYRYIVFNTILKTFVLPTASIVHLDWRTQRRRRAGVGS